MYCIYLCACFLLLLKKMISTTTKIMTAKTQIMAINRDAADRLLNSSALLLSLLKLLFPLVLLFSLSLLIPLLQLMLMSIEVELK